MYKAGISVFTFPYQEVAIFRDEGHILLLQDSMFSYSSNETHLLQIKDYFKLFLTNEKWIIF
jgi:hypothetical protein